MGEKMADSFVNLSALQRVDPYIIEILESATQVALYKFCSENKEWNKTGVEGTLFVYKRSAPPLYGFIIMNRLSKTNQVEPITKELELQREEPSYLLYRNSKFSIFGIWFYDKNDCTKVSEITTRLLQKETDRNRSQHRMRRASESDTSIDRAIESVAPTKNVDIISMLSKAQELYSKAKPVQEEKTVCEPKPIVENPNASSDLVRPKPMRVVDTMAENPQVTSSGQNETLSVEELFAIASKRTGVRTPNSGLNILSNPVTTSSSAHMASLSSSSIPASNPLLQRLMSNPENLVEHIERRQRSELPTIAPLAESLEKDLKEKLKLNVSTGVDKNETKQFYPDSDTAAKELLANIQNIAAAAATLKAQKILTPAMLEVAINVPPRQSPLLIESISTPFVFATPTKPPPIPRMSLMSPMMFMTKPIQNTQLQLFQSVPPPPPPTQDQNGTSSGGHAPVEGGREIAEVVAPLTKTQLSQALMHLLKTDAEFVSKLHEAYIKSLNQMTFHK